MKYELSLFLPSDTVGSGSRIDQPDPSFELEVFALSSAEPHLDPRTKSDVHSHPRTEHYHFRCLLSDNLVSV